ncbi:MAG: hypothetical protein LBU57_07150, partial [Dysgonamonadaceae bacterium]|nr:hypothetical protein [Dysgonamonadaceae bacterium]
MKRLVFSALILLYSYPAQLWAQSSNQNYIQTKILKNASGQLYVTKTTDENNHVTYEFRDKLDRVLLQRQISGTGSDRCHDTYFVYDDFGNLSF